MFLGFTYDLLMKYFLLPLIFALVFSCASQENSTSVEEPVSAFYESELKPFYHGVASGDPYPNSVLLWTRVTPNLNANKIEGTWEIAADSLFSELINNGTFETDSTKDFTVKVIADALNADTRYFYRFKALDAYSLVGKTKTAPETANEINFAVVSCSNYQFGAFNAYANISKKQQLDAVIHLGDYFYEYGRGTYGDTTMKRFHIPEHELIALDDYRTRYSQYRLDPDLRQMHATHPFIAIWDDHEIANDAYKTGAQNHQEDEGDYMERKRAAIKAYYEWMPVRRVDPLYRTFTFGNLVDLIMLDERTEGRTEQLDSITDDRIDSSSQRMLGKKQLAWLQNELNTSEASWKVIGNQVIFSYLNYGYKNFNINLDSWDGYPYERTQLKQTIMDNDIENVLFITGDTHSSWAFEVTDKPFEEYDAETSSGAFAIEFGATSVNSGNANERFPDDTVKMHEQKILGADFNPHLKYTNLRDHGYLLLNLTDSVATASWYYVNSMNNKDKGAYLGMQVSTRSGDNKIRKN